MQGPPDTDAEPAKHAAHVSAVPALAAPPGHATYADRQ
jgi:hypothetical protein